MDEIEELKDFVEFITDVPTFEKMPKRTLGDKGIAGPTSAHVIEEVHTPFNFEFLTFTTGTSGFQNIVGVVKQEIPNRIKASVKALELCSLQKGDRMLVTYPPLVNVFPKSALEEYGIEWHFLLKSSRDALILDICQNKPAAVIGESSFLRATIEDAKKTGFIKYFPEKLILITAGTALDLELLQTVKDFKNYTVHDLYGTQEFGWLTLDGIPLRDDISLVKSQSQDHVDLIVGGVPTGDRFSLSDTGHICNQEGSIITYSKQRTDLEYETIILETSLKNVDTLKRLIKTVLRIKGKIVRISPDIKFDCEKTKVGLKYYNEDKLHILEGKTDFLDSLLEAQISLQSSDKKDPTWIKRS